ncbi:MAG TPA: NAD-dependent epimerase/dehydratase family protein [Gallionella sp.]
MTSLLITGASGFIGEALCEEAVAQGFKVKGATRSEVNFGGGVDNVIVDQIDGSTDWALALKNVEVVIHLAARVHVMRDTAADPLAEFRRVNLHGTTNLAKQAASHKVRRFVYVSTIKVNGERTAEGQRFKASDQVDPQDNYAVSKWEAEQELRKIAHETGMEIVIIRPPLLYGPAVKGNFLSLLRAVDKGIPLPLASIRNARSMLYLGNLTDILLRCVTAPVAAGKTYLVRDGEDISMPDLVRLLGEGMGKRVRLFPLPLGLLGKLAAVAGRSAAFDRTTGSLLIDDAPIREELGWKPKFTLREGLQATARWYQQQGRRTSEPPLPKLRRNTEHPCRVSIVIVNYNAGEILPYCVAQASLQAEQVIVVDNASDDGSVAVLKESFPSVTVIANERNLGFAKACNQGARVASGDHILFLNPDCILESEAVERLVAAVHSADDVGMAGGLLTNPDGSEQGGGRRAVPTPWRSFVRVSGLGNLSGRYPTLFSDFALHKQPLPEKPIPVEAISGACMLVRRDALEQIGLLDEAYFMHCEDLDWCMRFRRAGWKLLFVPDARMVHYKGHCSKDRPIFVEWNKHKGMLRFYNKFFRHQYPGLLMGLVSVGVAMRFVAVTAYHLVKKIKRRAGMLRG